MDHTIKNGLVSGGIWVFVGKIFTVLCQLAVNAFMARLLLLSDMGLYFLVFSLVNFFMMFSMLGMQRSIVRIVTEALALDQPERAKLAVKYVIEVGFVASILIAIILVSGAGQFISKQVFGSPLISNIIYLPAIWLILLTLQTLIAESFRGYNDIRSATIFNGVISSGITAVFLGFFLLSREAMNIRSVLFLIISAHLVNLLIAIFCLRKHTGRLLLRSNGTITRSEVLRNSWVLYFANISLFVLSTAHLWLLAYFSTKENVAIYGAVMRLMIIITTSLVMLRFTVLPTIGHLYAKKRYRELENVLRVSATVAGLPAIFGLLFLILFGKSILLFIYGSYYVPGYSALIILSIANLVNVFTGVPGPLMVMASKERYILTYALVSGIVGLSLSISLVKSMSFLGVAIGSGIAIILNNLLMLWYCKKKLSISTLMDFNEISKIVDRFRSESSNLSIKGRFQSLFKF